MRDDFLSPDWANNHNTLSNALHQLITNIGETFAVLYHVQFDAPWRSERRH